MQFRSLVKVFTPHYGVLEIIRLIYYCYKLLRLLRVATVKKLDTSRGVNGKDKYRPNTEHELERHSQERIPLPKPQKNKFKKLILEKLKHPLQ